MVALNGIQYDWRPDYPEALFLSTETLVIPRQVPLYNGSVDPEGFCSANGIPNQIREEYMRDFSDSIGEIRDRSQDPGWSLLQM